MKQNGLIFYLSHHQRELSVIPQPKMLLADDFKAYSKLKVENHAFNRTALPGHYKVKEYCPLVFRALRERFDVSEVLKKLNPNMGRRFAEKQSHLLTL